MDSVRHSHSAISSSTRIQPTGLVALVRHRVRIAPVRAQHAPVVSLWNPHRGRIRLAPLLYGSRALLSLLQQYWVVLAGPIGGWLPPDRIPPTRGNAPPPYSGTSPRHREMALGLQRPDLHRA